MRALKRLIAIVGGAILGIFLLVFGVKDYLKTKALQAKGKSGLAEITGADEQSGRRGRKRYYLSISFKTESGATVISEERVSRNIYDQGRNEGAVKVTYLPDNPEVCRLGEVSTSWTNFGFGVILVGFAVVSAFKKGEA